MGLFSEGLSEWEDVIWLPLGCIEKLVIGFSLKSPGRFNVWYSMLGLKHLDPTEDSAWSVSDILNLPEWPQVGGTFIEDGVKEGYSEEFLENFTYYDWDTRPQSPRPSMASAVSSMRHSAKSSTRRSFKEHSFTGNSSNPHLNSPSVTHWDNLMEVLMGHNTGLQVLKAIRKYLATSSVNLSRFDVKLIAREVRDYCYSACSASSAQFRSDLINREFDTGDTQAIPQTLCANQLQEDKSWCYLDN